MPYSIYKKQSIYYEVHGEGEPLVILNGIMMSTASWQVFLPNLKAYQIILIDFLDQGKSDHQETFYSHDLQVEVIHHIITHLNLSKVSLAGISYGAQIALQYALKYQDYLSRLIIFNASSYTSPWLEDIGIAWQGAAKTNNPELFYHVAIPYIYSDYFYSKNSAWMRSRKKLLVSVFTEEFLGCMDRLIESSVGYDIRQKLININIPTLVVASDKDYITPYHEGEKLHQAIDHSSFMVIEQCGHASMYEKPNEFVTLLTGFMNLDDNIKIL